MRTAFRKGWVRFFEKAGLLGRMPRVVAGGGRRPTFELFQTAVQTHRPNVLPILLVDSEEAVTPGHSVWQHLNARDGWSRPAGSTDDQAFLMVQVTETWLVADRPALQRYFGPDFKNGVVPAWPDLEAVDKDAIYKALDDGTRNCRKKYAKGKVSFELVGDVDPTAVEGKCPHAHTFLATMRAVS